MFSFHTYRKKSVTEFHERECYILARLIIKVFFPIKLKYCYVHCTVSKIR